MKNKTNPCSVRFDIEQLEYIQKREKFGTNQQVVNFLLKAYWDVKHIPKNPFLEETNSLEPILAPQITHPIQSAIKKEETAVVSPVGGYKSELKDAKTVKEIEMTVKILKTDPNLTPREKIELELYAKEISKEMYTD